MKDQLSAMMDGEIEIESSEHIITSIKSGGELKEAWQHYHLIGDVMRGDVHMCHDFSMRVMQALDAEPTILAINKNGVALAAAEKTAAKMSLFRTTKVWSVAASVAAVMFVGLMVLQQQLGDSEEASPVEIAQNIPLEYLQAHQAAAPSGAAYYIQNANYQNGNFIEPQK
ncbi:MAG: sigma-E factor negative regulatory protein [Methylophilaceae bacterium]